MSRRHVFFKLVLCLTAIVYARTSHAEYGSSFALPGDAPKANVRDFGAKGDGTTDDTAAIKKAIASTYAAWEAIYLPAGTYLVSDSIDVGRFLTIRGDGTGKTIIKLKNNASGYGDRSKPKFVLRAILAADVTGHNNTTHSVHFMHFTVDVSEGNAGAVAVDFMAHNGGGIEDVVLKAPSGSGSMALSLLRDANGPSLFSRITINGFDTGIAIAGGVYGTVFEHLTLTGQKTVGIKNDQHPLTVRDLVSTNQVPAIHSEAPDYGMLVLLDSRLEGGAAGNAAVEATGSYLIRDLRVQGYGFALKSGNTNVPGPTIDERTSSPIRVSGASKAATLRMPVKEPPESPWDAPSAWQDVRAFENLVKNGDWTPAIQAAIDAGKPTVFFPNNTHSPYPCKGDVHVRGGVRRLIGMEANLGEGRLVIDGTDAKAVYYIEQMRADGGFVHASPATVVLRRSLGGSVTTKPGAGDLFVDDWCCGNFVVDHSNVWARQLNEESLVTKLQVNGGRLWILGLKTEQFGTVGRFQNGAAVEILGGLIYPAQGKPTTPMYVNEDSFFTAFHREIGNGYSTFDRETRNGKTTDVNPSFTQGTMFTSGEGWTGAVAPGTGGSGGVAGTGGSANTAGAGGSANAASMGGSNANRGGSSGGNGTNDGNGGNGRMTGSGGSGVRPSGAGGTDNSVDTGGTGGSANDEADRSSSNGCQMASGAQASGLPLALMLLVFVRRRFTRRS